MKNLYFYFNKIKVYHDNKYGEYRQDFEDYFYFNHCLFILFRDCVGYFGYIAFSGSNAICNYKYFWLLPDIYFNRGKYM